MLPRSFLAILASCFSVTYAAFPWISNATPSSDISPSDLLQSGPRRSALYEQALTELQELEAEPLCHRVAARLLVNNCQLLEGKDDASVHTDSGRQARDFVDSYAASLAICDLERASFAIPRACEAFREPTLSRIPLSNTAQLHVPEAQIRACLAGLGESPSAWNTWVSYSHKAVRFCEAARADHEKTQNILVFQKLTRIMAKMADDVEAELQRRMETWESVAKQMDARLYQAMPAAQLIWERLRDMEDLLEHRVGSTLNRAAAAAEDGARSTEALQQLLALVVKTALEGNSELAVAHSQAMEQAHEQTAGGLDVLASAVKAVVDTTNVLHDKISHAHVQADSLARRQESLQQGLDQLSGTTHTLKTRLDDHGYQLAQASNMTADLLDTIEATAAASATMQQSFVGRTTASRWWPFLACPVATIVMGSYGLPPSIVRNFGLFAVGELVGLFVSYSSHLTRAASFLLLLSGPYGNGTVTSH